MPYTWLSRPYLEKGGFTVEKYPGLHALLYEEWPAFLTFSAAVIFFWMIFTTPKRLFKYVLPRVGFFILSNSYLSMVSCAQMSMFFAGGRAWGYFPPLSAAMNDCWAYFGGRFLGRRKLIELSPNKTIEGFLTAIIANMIFTSIMMRRLTQYDFWTCIPENPFTLPFENY